jgi:sarcosine oxidase
VIGLERFELGHARGASEDHSRIIRRSYPSADYVRFTQQAFETWAEVAEESGEQLVTITGGLDLFPRDPIDEPDAFLAAMREEGVHHELLDAAALVARWPAWHVSDEIVAIHQHDAGSWRPVRANSAHRRPALARGADLLPETPVVKRSAPRVSGLRWRPRPHLPVWVAHRSRRVDERGAGALRRAPSSSSFRSR